MQQWCNALFDCNSLFCVLLRPGKLHNWEDMHLGSYPPGKLPTWKLCTWKLRIWKLHIWKLRIWKLRIWEAQSWRLCCASGGEWGGLCLEICTFQKGTSSRQTLPKRSMQAIQTWGILCPVCKLLDQLQRHLTLWVVHITLRHHALNVNGHLDQRGSCVTACQLFMVSSPEISCQWFHMWPVTQRSCLR